MRNSISAETTQYRKKLARSLDAKVQGLGSLVRVLCLEQIGYPYILGVLSKVGVSAAAPRLALARRAFLRAGRAGSGILLWRDVVECLAARWSNSVLVISGEISKFHPPGPLEGHSQQLAVERV